MSGSARCHLHPDLAQRWHQVIPELRIDLFQEFTLLTVNQRGLGTVAGDQRHDFLLDAAAPAVNIQRFRQQPAQTLRDGQLQAHPGQ